MIADCCYKALEQPSVTQVKCKYLRDCIINILGVLIKQYNHGLLFVVNSVQVIFIFNLFLLGIRLYRKQTLAL